ncbi:MAG: hypothetical protein A3D65_03815 [Candidatus Lloydbacteria bacterium RIFCSPHIGHO2_02_FULL_50_13]|uniref:Uncharacterized protein n=1 Tax=Candidatus Lloydbacteria bacterium RIFCSPHIGHO2_02_FULL_50_13 TaxID=1798661 RepID=A0A1G2D209_9BACT|nr:MAG: hypothetical protein A3D65_03815 [Candidatus Lloydbacteria bacterium RIFCSPHIGHO2_02_FULL_50_13]
MRINKKHAWFLLSLAIVTIIVPVVIFAAAPLDSRPPTLSFREFTQIPDEKVPIRVPTVIELPLDGRSFDYPFFAVKDLSDTNSDGFIASYFRRSTVVSATPMSVVASADLSWGAMLDNNYQTYASLAVPEDGIGRAVIELTSAKPVTASALTLLLDGEVALPNTILIQADTADGGTNTVLLNTTKMSGNTVRFPKTTSSRWRVTLTYSQPLRITELSIRDEDALSATTQGLRFLAIPGHDYVVYMNADRSVTLRTTESGDLVTDKGVVRIAPLASAQNHAYVIADTDGDGIPDIADNCVSLFNPLQEDVNQNGIGDNCEDFDRDRIVNQKDNCPNDPNVAQTDTDGDNVGDSCDGEESRITERHVWVPWVGMGIAALVLIVLFAFAIRAQPKSKEPKPPIQ